MNRVYAALFLIALATLTTELSLIRVFDVLFYPNIAYMIISTALFGLGLGAIYSVLGRPLARENRRNTLSKWAAINGIGTAAILPIVNLLPFDFNQLAVEPVRQLLYFGGMYLALVVPFFTAGFIFTNIFTAYADQAQSMYFWDLLGAALGSVILIPLIPLIGPGGLLLCAGAMVLFASALLSERKGWSTVASLVGLSLMILPLLYMPQYLDFKEHQGKRGVKWAREHNMIERTVWDPVSKIDVIDYEWMHKIAYDGGSQETVFFPFDGDFVSLRNQFSEDLTQHFWRRPVLASHHLKRDTGHRALIIGSAGGQETKAALMYGASHVDAVEMVAAVVKLGLSQYDDYIGGIFHHPNVDVHIDEGRSFLRASREKYDVIQIHSNHTSSSVARGTGAVATNYLQTAEAYQEYFEHLTDNGILHINHHVYPRMVTTAALAWKQMGRGDFQKHVIVFQRDEGDTLPTFLVKMQPWTVDEVTELKAFFSTHFPGDADTYYLVEDPLNPETSRLTAAHFSGELPAGLLQQIEYRIEPATDNRPYFNFLRKSLGTNDLASIGFGSESIARIPLDVAPLLITGFASLLVAVLFTVVPLRFAKVGRDAWPGRALFLVYFASLGAGFIIIELILIQIFMRLIGSPLYTYSTVIFVLLLGASIGSLTSRRLKISPTFRWYWPFLGILIITPLVFMIYPGISAAFLASQQVVRLLVAAVLILPVGFFLGMPFPLGILSLENQPQGAIAWAYGMNGLFTVLGSLAAVIASIQWGFNTTLFGALLLYILALLAFYKARVVTLTGSDADAI